MVVPMSAFTPSSPEELAAVLGAAASRRQSIALGGRFSKRRMGGFVRPSEVTVSTAALNRVVEYEPKDLTISVGAGMAWCELERTLAAERQMIPLDPPFSDSATVGGVIAANCSGPRRRLYGTARDLVIGMKFATLAGKVVQSGGMVVKNVAGLDMAKLMIGSFGTLAAIASVNFKVIPMPAGERTFLLSFDTLAAAVEARDAVLRSVLQPAALDLLNPPAAARLSQSGYLLAVSAGGNPALIGRYGRELGSLGRLATLEGDVHAAFWRGVRNFTSDFVSACAGGAVVRISITLSRLRETMESLDVPALARAGSGVCYALFEETAAASRWLSEAARREWKAIMEFAPEERAGLTLWPKPGEDFAIFERIKRQFDPEGLLNRGRLYNRI
jgi:glycolate oxidase FAD binding subunit